MTKSSLRCWMVRKSSPELSPGLGGSFMPIGRASGRGLKVSSDCLPYDLGASPNGLASGGFRSSVSALTKLGFSSRTSSCCASPFRADGLVGGGCVGCFCCGCGFCCWSNGAERLIVRRWHAEQARVLEPALAPILVIMACLAAGALSGSAGRCNCGLCDGCRWMDGQ